MLARAETQQSDPDQVALGEVERAGDQLLDGSSRLGLAGHVGPVHRRRPRREHLLHRAAAGLDEPGAQALVPGGGGIEGPDQPVGVELAAQQHGGGDVVGGIARVEPVEEPEASLRRGQRMAHRATTPASSGSRPGSRQSGKTATAPAPIAAR